MGRKARVYEASFVQTFEDKFYSQYPEVKTGASFQWKDAVKVLRALGLSTRVGNEYPFYFFTNKISKGIYKMPTKKPLISGSPEALASSAVKPTKKVVGSKKANTPNAASRAWSSGKVVKSNISKTTKEDRDITASYDDSVTYEDAMSLRNEFGLGEFKNTMD